VDHNLKNDRYYGNAETLDLLAFASQRPGGKTARHAGPAVSGNANSEPLAAIMADQRTIPSF